MMAPPYAPYRFPDFRVIAGYPTSGSPTFNTTTLNNSAYKIGWTFTVPNDLGRSLTVTKIYFRYGTRTGTPPTYRASLQSLDASGNPDGTVLGGGSPASVVFTPPADTSWNATGQVVTLDNPYMITPGQTLAIVIDYSSGTIDASNCSGFTRNCDSWTNTTRLAFPHAEAYTGSWGSSTGSFPVYGVGTSDGRYWGFPQLSGSTTSLGTNGYRAAMRFVVPPGVCDSFTFCGLRVAMTAPAAGSNTFTPGLWDSAGNAIVTGGALDSDLPITGSSRFHEYTFTSQPKWVPPGVYYLGIQRNTVTLDVIGLIVSSAEYMTAFNGPDDLSLATWNGSAWSQTATSRPCIEPIGVYVRNRSRLRGGRLGVLR